MERYQMTFDSNTHITDPHSKIHPAHNKRTRNKRTEQNDPTKVEQRGLRTDHLACSADVVGGGVKLDPFAQKFSRSSL